jgi:hypothetical protein
MAAVPLQGGYGGRYPSTIFGLVARPEFNPSRRSPLNASGLFQKDEGKGLAAFLGFHNLHRNPGSLIQAPHSGAFENGRMHEYVLFAVLA